VRPCGFHFLGHCFVVASRERNFRGVFRNYGPILVLQFLDDCHRHRKGSGVVQGSLYGHRSLPGVQFTGGIIHPPWSDMDGTGSDEPYVAVDSRAGIPAGVGRFGMVDAHGEGIGLSCPYQGSDVMKCGDITIGTHSQGSAVDKNLAVAVNAFEVQEEFHLLISGRNFDFFAVPGNSARQVSGGAGQGGAVRPFDAPVVRKVQCLPAGVVIIGG